MESSVDGFSQMFHAEVGEEFTEERSSVVDLVEGGNTLRFPFSMINGTATDLHRWDPANIPSSLLVTSVALDGGWLRQELPIEALIPVLDLLEFRQDSDGLHVVTGSYDGQTGLSVETRRFYLQVEALNLAACLAAAAAFVGLVLLLESARRRVRRRTSEEAWGQPLSSAFNPRSNALNFIRLVLAILVILTHSSAIAGYEAAMNLGFLGEGLVVDAFFGLSGFLMARTLTRRPDSGRYLWHRFVRLFPAFLFALVVVALAVAPIATLMGQGSLTDFWFAEDGPFGFVLHNSTLWLEQPSIADGPLDVPVPGEWNAPIWTMGWTFPATSVS